MTTLSDILVFIQSSYSPESFVWERTLLGHFPASDLAHLVELQVLGCREVLGRGRQYWVRPMKIDGLREDRGTRHSYAKSVARDAARWRGKVAA